MKKRKNKKHNRTARTYKNNVFCMLFKDKEHVLALYNAINHSSHTDPGELKIVTLENALYMSIKNDLAFVIDTRLNLYEHQSTYNPNMPLRDLYYISSEYEGLISRQSTYASTRVQIPAPRFLVFYNGNQERPEVEEFKLSDLYETPEVDPQLELKVTVLNINPGKNEALLQTCTVLNEYMQYVNCVRQKLTKYSSIDEAVSEAVDECIRKGILREFLIKNKARTIHMSIFEYNKTEEMKKLRRQEYKGGYSDGLEVGRAEGLEVGRAHGQQQKLASIVQKKLQKGLSAEEIAELLEEDITVIQKIQNELLSQVTNSNDITS